MPIIRRFHSNIVSSRQVATEISNLVSGSNVEQSGRSSAPLTPNRPIRKRVNNAERREMLESFVNKYRAMNLGKFPSPTTAHKEVGGGYYSIKKMLQEMEYNFKMSPAEKDPTKENKKQIEGDDAISQEIAMESSGSQEKSNGQIIIEQNICEDPSLASGNNFDKNTFTGYINSKGDDALSKEVAMEPSGSQEKSNGQIGVDQNLCEDPCLESGSNFDKNTCTGNTNVTRDDNHNFASESDEKTEQNPRDDDFAFKDSELKVEKQSDRIRNITRDDGEKDNELREKASLWGNLKSLANELFNIWKK